MHLPASILPIAGGIKVKLDHLMRSGELERAVQRYRGGAADLGAWSYQIFSQHGEDGVLAGIIDRVGVGPRKFVEFGFGQVQNNTLGFALREKAAGLYIDGSERNCAAALRMFQLIGRPDIKVTCAWIEEANIDQLVASGTGGGEIDVLSIDVDGNDYWLWKAIKSVTPRISIIEYNASFGPGRAVTVPYDRGFERHKKHKSGLYHGMSLRAAAHLGREKGYALVGCDRDGVNAFFVRRDLLGNGLSEIPAERAYRGHQNRLSRGLTPKAQSQIVYSLPVVDV